MQAFIYSMLYILFCEKTDVLFTFCVRVKQCHYRVLVSIFVCIYVFLLRFSCGPASFVSPVLSFIVRFLLSFSVSSTKFIV